MFSQIVLTEAEIELLLEIFNEILDGKGGWSGADQSRLLPLYDRLRGDDV